jgi:hypothetical protein
MNSPVNVNLPEKSFGWQFADAAFLIKGKDELNQRIFFKLVLLQTNHASLPGVIHALLQPIREQQHSPTQGSHLVFFLPLFFHKTMQL